jgi:hypothetical protein
MVKQNKASIEVRSFPVTRQVPESRVGKWTHQLLSTRDNLFAAIEFLRLVCDEILAGQAVNETDEILTQVEAILNRDEKIYSTRLSSSKASGQRSSRSQKKDLRSSSSLIEMIDQQMTEASFTNVRRQSGTNRHATIDHGKT